jgi:hypothetical protein
MNNLTKIAALPGSGAGCMASLPAERMEAKKPEVTEPEILDWSVWRDIDWSRIDLSEGFGC